MTGVIGLTAGTRDWLWQHLLDADFNSRYWRCIVERYKRRDKTAQIFLAVTTSGTVAGWALWNELPAAWQTLSAASSLVAVALPILSYPSKVEVAADLFGRWTELCSEYERLWVSAQDGTREISDDQMSALARRENSNLSQEASFPLDRKLAARCQAEVKRRRGLA